MNLAFPHPRLPFARIAILFASLATSSVASAQTLDAAVASKFTIRTLAGSLNTPMGVEADATYVYVTEFAGNTIQRVKRSDGTLDPFASTPSVAGPQALAFPPLGSSFPAGLYISRGTGGSLSGGLLVDRLDLATGVVTPFAASGQGGENWPFNIAFAPNGELFQVDSGGPDTVVRYSAAGTRVGATGDTGENLSGLATAKGSIGFGNFVYYVKYSPGFVRINADLSYTNIPLSPAPGSALLDVAFPPPSTCFGDLAFITEKSNQRLHAVDATGAQTIFASGFTFAGDYTSGGLAFSPTGDALFITDDAAGKVYAIEPAASEAGGCQPCNGNFGSAAKYACPTSAAPACDFGTGKCFECVGNGDCSGNKPFCVANTCTKCDNGNVATACAASTPVCTAAGACSTCNADNGVSGNACPDTASPYCNGGTGTCGTCSVNSDCAAGGATHSGANCIAGACTDSCSVATESTSCLPGQYCDDGGSGGLASCSAKLANGKAIPAAAPFSGTCSPAKALRACESGVCSTSNNLCGAVKGEACAVDASCQTGKCAGGIVDAGAPLDGGPLDAGTPGLCVDCKVDLECGGVTSGKICNAGGSCVDGCRGTGGNGCPSGNVCSSTTATAGTCAPPVIDAGTDASVPDASVSDSGVKADSGPTLDAGNVDDDGSIEGGGIACSTSGTGGASSLPILAVLGLLLAARRRRA